MPAFVPPGFHRQAPEPQGRDRWGATGVSVVERSSQRNNPEERGSEKGFGETNGNLRTFPDCRSIKWGMSLRRTVVAIILLSVLMLIPDPVLATETSYGWAALDVFLHIITLGEGTIPVRAIPGPGEVAVDLHIHTCYSPDSASNIAEILLTAARRGFAAIAVTDHDTVAGAWMAVWEAQRLKRQGLLPPDFVVIPGQEISTVEGHILGLFIHETIPALLPAKQAIDLIHAQNGLAVAAHPGSIKGIGYARVKNLPLDAVESCRPSRGFVTVLGSDAHSATMVGLFGYTAVRIDEPLSEASLYRSIRDGKTRPVAGSFTLPGSKGPQVFTLAGIIAHVEVGLTAITGLDAVKVTWPGTSGPAAVPGGLGLAAENSQWPANQPSELHNFLFPRLDLCLGPICGWVNPRGEWRIGVYLTAD